MFDLVLLRLGTKLESSLPIDPFPAPIDTHVKAYSYHGTTIRPNSTPVVESTWQDCKVSFYTDGRGREAKTGTYDMLQCLHFDHLPSAGSSGGPILDAKTQAVVGIIRGWEHAGGKLRGFASPAESLFECFSLPGLPEEVD
ncbi:unnamed protein product [Didymodactylos carnosus]|uniref:Trypsin-like serine protease n=1 Tax=Didymodactylos carnosus TaxID=1234261 RepID=A0A814W228_9BILA|nr:unnamed protein product [Didymodactylos carnosus]CAF3960371.1 unnamed protein product [Didymodactylos carnosus]